jgi:uncharacterized protein
MLPQFPKFKELELSDAEDVQRYTARYAPFSDFNFACLWSWNIESRVLLSELNGNLVVRLGDYVNGEVFYSFLGDSRVNDTVEALIDLSCRENLEPRLQLVPEVAAGQLDPDRFAVTEDDRHADYILMVDRLCTYQGSRLASKRNEVRKFLRLCPQTRFETLDLDDAAIIEQCQRLFRRWNAQRGAPHDPDTGREFKAFDRCLKSQSHFPLIGAGIFADDELVALSILEIVDNKYAFTHFEKADIANFPGIGSFLNQQVASLLAARGIEYINIEQDLGIAGLRMSKRSYFPCGYLRKFSVSYRESQAA